MPANPLGNYLIKRRTLGALGAVMALVVISCDRGPVLASPPPAGPFVVGAPVYEANGWIEYLPGDAPLIIIAPHGGRLKPFRFFTMFFTALHGRSVKNGVKFCVKKDVKNDVKNGVRTA